jgi:acyl dehydratase
VAADASGWHTCAQFMRLVVDGLVRDTVGRGSPGVDEVRWLHPVRPGDRLDARFTVTDLRPSASKPDRGIIRSLGEMHNQDGVVVMTLRGIGLYGRRPTD